MGKLSRNKRTRSVPTPSDRRDRRREARRVANLSYHGEPWGPRFRDAVAEPVSRGRLAAYNQH